MLFLCEHAARDFPERFGALGLDAEVQRSHVAWDPGALDLAQALSLRLGGALVSGAVSRLLYDCNRPPTSPAAIPETSEIFDIPGNVGLSEDARAARIEEIYRPFCAEVDRVIASCAPGALVTVHSFTPVYFGRRRDVEIGILHDTDARMADAMLAAMDGCGFEVRRNAPYGPEDGVTHSLKLHAQSRGLPNVMIEVRNDLLAEADTAQRVETVLAGALSRALGVVGVMDAEGEGR